MLIRDFLQKKQHFSRRILNAIKFEGGKILVNGVERRVGHRLQSGDRLTIYFPPEKKGDFMIPENIKLSIVYEDEDILVVNKPPYMAVTPSPLQPTGTVANGVLAYYEENNIPYTVHVVTRLDRNTSGLLLIAKHRYSHSILASFQQDYEVKRKYQAIIEGSLDVVEGSIRAPISRKEGSIIERMVNKSGKQAITHYKVDQELNGHTLVKVELETGRTHQIRVHFSHLGHPLAGDDLYGGSTQFINRQALHCYELSFQHPLTNKRMFFKLPLPKDMNKLFLNN